MKVTEGKPTDFIPDKDNANQGSPRGQKMIQDSLQEDGAGRGIVVDKNDNVVAGNKTLESAVDVGIDKAIIVETTGNELVITKRLDWDLYEDESPRRYAYRDNRSSEVSLNWSPDQLLLDKEAGIDFSGLFYENEFDEIIADVKKEPPEESPPPVDKAAELQEKWGTALGQIWQIGPHRIACGDCTDRGVVEGVMEGEKADCLIADPPYGMRLDTSYSNSTGNVSKGIKKSVGYKKVIGDDRPFDPTPLFEIFSSISDQFWWGADYYRDKLPNGGSWLVWDKRASVEDVKYSSSEFELCWSKNRHHRIILRVPWFGVIGTEQQDTQKRLHPTQKPLGVITLLLEKYCNSLVIDPFLGSGTSMVAAHQLNRICYGIEISPAYAAVCLQRISDYAGIKPVLLSE